MTTDWSAGAGFPEVLRDMIDNPGHMFRRSSWRSDKWIYYTFLPGRLPHIEIHTSDGCAPYVPSQCDMRAGDWEERQ
jgi:hypothetical protein